MKIVFRLQAKSLGLNRYFTGNRCQNGHLCERYVLRAKCVECTSEKNRRRRGLKIAETRLSEGRENCKICDIRLPSRRSAYCGAACAKQGAMEILRSGKKRRNKENLILAKAARQIMKNGGFFCD